MLLFTFRVVVFKSISVFYVVPNIWFCVDGNAGVTIKKISLHVQDLSKILEQTEQSRSGFLGLYSISAPREDIGRSVSYHE